MMMIIIIIIIIIIIQPIKYRKDTTAKPYFIYRVKAS
jgi:hypothetical protein